MTQAAIICPCCGEAFDPQAVAQGKDLATLETILRQFGESRALAADYIGLFRAAPGKSQRVSTKIKLANELLKLWLQREFSYNGRAWRVSRGQITEALAEVIRAKAPAAGFKNHNYLKTVLLQKASRTEARDEARREAARRNPAQRPAAEPERWDQDRMEDWPPAKQAAALADLYRNPGRIKFMRGVTETLQECLQGRGVDIGRLLELARETEPADGQNFSEDEGRRLLARCTKRDAAPTPAGDCLPLIGGSNA